MEFCFLSIHRRNPRSRINSSSFKSDLIHIIIIKTRCETYISRYWNCNSLLARGEDVRSLENSCLLRAYGSSMEQFEKNYRSPRGSRETFATNWLRGYSRATVLCTCSPLLRRRNFVKSPASGSRELLRIMRTTSLSLPLSKLSLIFKLFPIVSISVFACDQNLKRVDS